MKKILVMVSIGLLIFSSGFFFSNYIDNSKEEKLNQQYPLLAKRLFIDNPNDIRFDFRKLKASLEADLVAGLGEDEKRVSVYFEYLPSNISMSINPEMRAVAASLLKTAVAMEIYKSIEEGSLTKQDVITLQEENLDPAFGDLYQVGAGATFTVDELLDKMLKESDNTASSALMSKLNSPFDTLNVLKALDIQQNANTDNRLIISAKEYSQIFKCLYLSCYNTKEHSQEIMQTLTETNFTDRIKKLMPENTVVSHKIGNFNNEYQSDCGVIYANEGTSNYLLCIMVNSEDPEASEEIARVSYKIFSYVNSLQ